MAKNLKAAVIGVGNMGKNHVRVYSELPGIVLAAVSDLNQNIGKQLSDQYGANYYKKFEEMIEKEKPDLVSVCVPTTLHFKVASKCLERKINVLVEKPIASKVSEAKKLDLLAKKNKVLLLVGHIERYNPAVKKVKELIEKNEVGKVISVMARRVGGFPSQIKDANIAVDLAIHDIDIVNYILNARPLKVVSNKQRNHIKNREDSVEFFLKYKKASAFIQANWMTPLKIRKLNITGTEGYLEMDYINQTIDIFKSNYEKFREVSGDFSDYILKFSEPDIIKINVAKKEPLKEEIRHFISCIASKNKVDCQHAIHALKIALS